MSRRWSNSDFWLMAELAFLDVWRFYEWQFQVMDLVDVWEKGQGREGQ